MFSHLYSLNFCYYFSNFNLCFGCHYFKFCSSTLFSLLHNLSFWNCIFTVRFHTFFPDLKQIVDIIIQVLFWLTPIIWDYRIFPNRWSIIYKYNPFFCIVEGYKDALTYKQGINFDYYDYIFLLQVIIYLDSRLDII